MGLRVQLESQIEESSQARINTQLEIPFSFEKKMAQTNDERFPFVQVIISCNSDAPGDNLNVIMTSNMSNSNSNSN